MVDRAHAADDPERIGDVRPEVWTTAQDLLASVGIIEEKADIDDILDDSLIEEINDFDLAEIDEASSSGSRRTAARSDAHGRGGAA